MSMLVVLSALAMLQQPTKLTGQARRDAFDSSRAAIGHLADKVADVRSALDVYRRAVFNGSDADVLTAAGVLGTSCHGMDSVAARTYRTVCPTCAYQANVRQAFASYRAAVPSVRSAGAQCSTRLRRLSAGAGAAKGLRRDVREVGNPLVAALRGYERRLHDVLESLNAMPPT